MHTCMLFGGGGEGDRVYAQHESLSNRLLRAGTYKTTLCKL